MNKLYDISNEIRKNISEKSSIQNNFNNTTQVDL